jgi:hypothetical protein
MQTVDLARVSALLDEAKDLIAQISGLIPGTWPEPAVRAHRKIDEAQRVLVGDRPTRAEDN